MWAGLGLQTSDELKDLEKKLQVGYVNKERAAQHQEYILMRKTEREREQAIEDYMERQRQLAIKVSGDPKGTCIVQRNQHQRRMSV